MPQLFSPGANTLARVGLLSIPVAPVVLTVFLWGIMRSHYVTGAYIAPEQPVPFSHEHHVGGLGLDCRYCHNSVEKSRFAGLPPTETCMTCHSQLWTQAPMLAPVRVSLASGQPIPWKRVNALPNYVYFDHSIHVAKGVGCTTCHGLVDRMPLMRQEAPLTMNWCLSCHRDPVPNLRPLSQVFSTSWTPPKDQMEQGRRLLAQYLIHTEHLTDCSTCHR